MQVGRSGIVSREASLRIYFSFVFFLFFFEDSNEEIMGREQKQKVLW